MESDAFFQRYQLLMSHYVFGIYIIAQKTRCYHDMLHFCDDADQLNAAYLDAGRISQGELDAYDRDIIELRLTMLDKLDHWDDYLKLYERVRTEKDYRLRYISGTHTDEAYFNYLLSSDGHFDEVHFLYKQHHRYRLIQQKLARWRRGRKVGNLRHKPRNELTDEQIEERWQRALVEIAFYDSS